MTTWIKNASLSPDLEANARPDRLFDAYVFDLDGTLAHARELPAKQRPHLVLETLDQLIPAATWTAEGVGAA